MAEVVGEGGSQEEMVDLKRLGQEARRYLQARDAGLMNDMEDALLHLDVLAKQHIAKWYSKDDETG
jgi:hypothetical protein